MDDDQDASSFLNVFDIVDEGSHRHLLCFIEPELARENGVDSRSIVGQFQPGPDDELDPATLVINTEFLEAFIRYMNEEAAYRPDMRAEAHENIGGKVFLLDPRAKPVDDDKLDGRNILGSFEVDDAGVIVPGSFIYNDHHTWFCETNGISGVFTDRVFYDWLHPSPASGQ